MSAKPSYDLNSSRYWLRMTNAEFAAEVTSDMIVLDAGAGQQPYRDLFDHATYESADFEAVEKAYAPSTYVCDLASIPVADARFDRIVLNQVLEHIPDPPVVLAELFRVLKPGGQILCTCPLFYEEHEQPYDFYRYTQYGLRHLFVGAGFEVNSVEWMEGYYGTVAYQFSLMARALPAKRPKSLRGWTGWVRWQILRTIRSRGPSLARMFWAMDKVDRYTAKGLPKNYAIIARKPD